MFLEKLISSGKIKLKTTAKLHSILTILQSSNLISCAIYLLKMHIISIWSCRKLNLWPMSRQAAYWKKSTALLCNRHVLRNFWHASRGDFIVAERRSTLALFAVNKRMPQLPRQISLPHREYAHQVERFAVYGCWLNMSKRSTGPYCNERTISSKTLRRTKSCSSTQLQN